MHQKVCSLFDPPRTLHCLGDSHAMVFEYIAHTYTGMFRATKFKFCIVQGATNLGLANPHSQTQAFPIFKKYIAEEIDFRDTVLFILGEIDCGFVIWYRAQKYGLAVEKQFNESKQNFFTLINLAKQKVGKKIILCDVPLPTLHDNQKVMGEVANKRLEVKATLRERTDLTLRYNDEIHTFAARDGLQCIQYQNEILDQESKTVSEKYLSKDPRDHHLSNENLSVLLAAKLQQLSFR
ncbi:MAG: hypothetical protein WCQ99_00155 [Pseudomonadota bacterium]